MQEQLFRIATTVVVPLTCAAMVLVFIFEMSSCSQAEKALELATFEKCIKNHTPVECRDGLDKYARTR